MGNQESSLSDMPETLEQLAGRLDLNALARDYGRKSSEKDYIYLDGGIMKTPPSSRGSDGYEPYSETVSVSKAEQWEKELMEDPKNRLALSALSGTDPKVVLTQRSSTIAASQNFNTKISMEGAPITNQRSSGRCWLFAATNVFRVAIMRRYNLKEFELSQSYLFFWDKLEKANWFLEQVLDTVDEDLDGRLVQCLMAAPVGDGGQWDMVANLVEKYGLVPQHFYPDSHNAMNSSTMGSLITTKLRENALELRRLAGKLPNPKSSLGGVKDNMMREIHRILTIMLGPPPSPNREITWEFYDKEDNFESVSTTPLEFAGELSSKHTKEANKGVDVHELFSLVNDPRNNYGELLSVSRLGNVVGMRGVRYVNVDMKTIKDACIQMLEDELPIFFGSDVGKCSDSKSGIMDTGLIDYELGFNIRLGLTKAHRLMTGESAMTHAMVLTAVHVVDGKPVRWRVQNSWGETPGTKGWFVMTDEWMDEFVYQAVVDPQYVSKDVREVLNKEPNMLPLWDPMGALA